MCKEGWVGTAEPVKPISRAFGLVAQSLELSTCPPNDIGIDPLQGRTQLRLVEVTVVGDPAADARVVHLGQLGQGFVAAVMQRPAANLAADVRQRLRAGGGLETVREHAPPPDAPLFASFPEYSDLAADPARNRWTIRNLLTMTMGTDWDELSVPYTDPTNSETAMDMAADRYRFILGAPVVIEPDKRWLYSGGATALLARIIAKGTGKRLDAFAREALFDPLGIGPTEWLADRRGEPIAASGLRMTPRDLVRIGSMMLKSGTWGERRVVSAQWIERSTSPMVDVDEIHSYGYLWYLGKFAFTASTGPRWDRSRLQRFWSAIGNGGQRLFMLPGLDLAVAITAGNYDPPDRWVPPTRVMREVVLPSIL